MMWNILGIGVALLVALGASCVVAVNCRHRSE